MVSPVAQERHQAVLSGVQRWRDFDDRASKAMNPLRIQVSVDAAAKWGEACHFLRRKVEEIRAEINGCFNCHVRIDRSARGNQQSDEFGRARSPLRMVVTASVDDGNRTPEISKETVFAKTGIIVGRPWSLPRRARWPRRAGAVHPDR